MNSLERIICETKKKTLPFLLGMSMGSGCMTERISHPDVSSLVKDGAEVQVQPDCPIGKQKYYEDSDGDGYGANTGWWVCDNLPGYVTNTKDCDDTNSSIYPGAPELCDNKDRNCDGIIIPLCKGNELCQGGLCVCQPNCYNKGCGDDGCDGSCGNCGSKELCKKGECIKLQCYDSKPYDTFLPVDNKNFDSSCADFFTCGEKCPTGNKKCIEDCFSLLTIKGKQERIDLINCLTNNCSDKPKEKQRDCIKKNCLDQYYKCFSGNKYNQCKDLFYCLMLCYSNDKECLQECFSNATYQANLDYYTLVNCCSENKLQCTVNITMYNLCKNEMSTCVPTGPLKCGELFGCLQNSLNDSKVFSNNYISSTLTAQSLFLSLGSCLNKWCQNSNDSCITSTLKTKCNYEYNICLADQATN